MAGQSVIAEWPDRLPVRTKKSWGNTLDDGKTARFRAVDIAPILAVLEQQLIELDRLEAWVAAAHLDASIQHLRLDCYGTLSKPH